MKTTLKMRKERRMLGVIVAYPSHDDDDANRVEVWQEVDGTITLESDDPGVYWEDAPEEDVQWDKDEGV